MAFVMLLKTTTRSTSLRTLRARLAALETDPADVLITDLRLGAEDGMDLMEKALKLPQPADLHHDDRLRFSGYGGGGDEARRVRFRDQAGEY